MNVKVEVDLLTALKLEGVERVVWRQYYYNDEGHFDYVGSSPLRPSFDLYNAIRELEEIYEDATGNGYGEFVLDVEAGTISKVADVYMPEPELVRNEIPEHEREVVPVNGAKKKSRR